MIAVEPIIDVIPTKTLKATKPEVSLTNGGKSDVEAKKAPHEKPHYYSLKDNIKLRYECLMKSKAPTCLCILFYIFVCIFGNTCNFVGFRRFNHRNL